MNFLCVQRPGSVVVDLAAEAGGNIETTKPGEVYTYKDVVHVGLTDLPSRLPTQSSTLYANNISKFLLSIGEKDHFHINLEDEVVRGSIVLQQGKLLWPPPPPKIAPPPPAPAVQEAAVKAEPKPKNYFQETLQDALMYTGGLGGLVGLGVASPGQNFTTMTTIFGLSGIVGYHTVWGVVPALHSKYLT